MVLGARLFNQTPSYIPANSDFNDYVTPGAYRVRNYSDSVTIANRPANIAGLLYYLSPFIDTDKEKYGAQIFISSNGFYVRTLSNATWSNWKNLLS